MKHPGATFESTADASRRVRAEIAEEIQFHIDQAAAELESGGLDHATALAEARHRFGNVEAIADACYQQRRTDRNMLQRIHTVLIVALLVAVVGLLLHSNARANSYRAEIDTLHARMEQLAQENAHSTESAAGPTAQSGEDPDARRSEAADFDKWTLPDDLTAQTEVERAFAEWLANRPGAGKRLVSFGEDAVPYAVRVLRGEARIRGLDEGTARFLAANRLGDMGSALAVDPLLAALKDPWFNVRRCAALALGRLGDARAIGPLEELAASDPYLYRPKGGDEPRPLVRIDAEKALEMLRSK